MKLSRATSAAVEDLSTLEFGDPIATVYNPLIHAKAPHAEYMRRYGNPTKEFILLGMNPGPYGMVQTGIPFGEIEHVRNWLGIEGKVERPLDEHPKRPVLGFECQRSEVSGRRLWSWCQQKFGSPENFFDRFYVHNYCPLAFMVESGSNLTPDKIIAKEKKPLFEICDRYLRAVVEILEPRVVIGVGSFAEKQAKSALSDMNVSFGRIPHPSPASPLANRGWAEAADAAFAEMGIHIPTL